MNTDEQIVAKVFTGARKFPKVVGRLLDGQRIPGGPYRVSQLVAGGSVFLLTLGGYAIGLWRLGNPVFDFVVGTAFVAMVFWVTGKLPQTKRNPLSVAGSFMHAFVAPRGGVVRGRFVTLPRSHSARSSRTFTASRPAPAVASRVDTDPVEVPVDDIAAGPLAASPTPAPATGLARLLAQLEPND
ncbi:hypothetical protein [Leifsonia shinshuensis]